MDVFRGPRGRFHLSSTDVAPWRDPTAFQRLLETSEGNIWKRGMLSTEEQTLRESHLAARANPKVVSVGRDVDFHLQNTGKLCSRRPASPSEVERQPPFNDLSPPLSPGTPGAGLLLLLFMYILR